MTTSEQNAEQVGANAFRAEHSLSQNPYRFPKPTEYYARLADAWERGWKAAQKADWQYFPMAGRG